MSGFSADWLALREAADHRARDAGLVRLLRDYFSDAGEGAVAGRKIQVLDLGCGTGSNLRGLAPALGQGQEWTLVDYDAALLERARSVLEQWRKNSEQSELPDMSFRTLQADLNSELEQVLASDCDLVTAAALFDLVSTAWIDGFVAMLAERRRAFYTVLIYDGRMRWETAHSADDAIVEAFNAHQQSEKSFGHALGPKAGPYLADALRKAGYQVHLADSPWILGADDAELAGENARGVAQAAQETGTVPEADLQSWRCARGAGQPCEIGHVDILALPG